MAESKLEQEITEQLMGVEEIPIRSQLLKRLCRVVAGMLLSGSIAPSRIAASLAAGEVSGATEESLERQVRRYENDERVTAECSFHPFARRHLLLGRPKELLLVLDPTTQEERVVMVMVAVWYRGTALPLAWVLWPGNQPLKGERFWARVAQLLAQVQQLLPPALPVILVADRAFGTPVFIDLVVKYGWLYVVRVQGQTRYRTYQGQELPVQTLVGIPGTRKKLSAHLFKKRDWRWVSLVAFWGKRHQQPLLLVSNLPPAWRLIKLYKRRFPIEALFRDCKSDGWHFEQGQVVDLNHLQRLVIAMAFATWMTLLVGSALAHCLLAQPPTGKRRTRPYDAKFSLFAHGLRQLHRHNRRFRLADCFLDFHVHLNWSEQLTFLHCRAFVFSC
jgi:hypothetical protein